MSEQGSAPPVDGAAFGMIAPLETEGTEDFLSEDLKTEAAPQQQPDAGQAAVGEVEAPTDGEAQPTQGETLYMGRYRTPEEVVAAYKNVQRLEARTRQEKEAAEARAAQYEAALRQVATRLQAQEEVDEYGQPQQPDPQQLQQWMQQQAVQAQRQAQEQVLASQVTSEIDSFRSTYTDVTPGSDLDQMMAHIITDYQTDNEGRQDHQNFPVTRQNLEVAYVLARNAPLYDMMQELDLIPTEENLRVAQEATANPAFAQVLKAMPDLVETDEGLAYARQQAQMPAVVATAQQQARPNPQAQRKAAFVETGGTGAPAQGAPGKRPMDEVDQAIAAYRSDSQSVFGV